jgi:hypothetical protein
MVFLKRGRFLQNDFVLVKKNPLQTAKDFKYSIQKFSNLLIF